MNDICNVESLPEWKDPPERGWVRLDGEGCWYQDKAGKLYWREGDPAVQSAPAKDWLSEILD